MRITIARRFVVLLACALLATGCTIGRQSRTRLLDVPLLKNDGSHLRLGKWSQAKPMVVNFWATWCHPCKVEMPYFNKVYGQFREQGVEFVGIAFDEDNGFVDIGQFLSQEPVDYLIVLDEDGSAASASGGLEGLPTTLFVDRHGVIIDRHMGKLREDELRDKVLELLED